MAGFPPKSTVPMAKNADTKTPQPKGAKHKPMMPNPAQMAHSTGFTPRNGPPMMPAKAMPMGSMPTPPSAPMPPSGVAMGSMVAPPDPAMMAKMRASLKGRRKAM